MGWKFWQVDKNKKETIKRKRKLELEKTMRQLVKTNMVIASIEDWYLLIPLYIHCINKKEWDYCKYTLREYSTGAFGRYDEERLM